MRSTWLYASCIMRPRSLVYTDSYGNAFCAARGPIPKNTRLNATANCSSAGSSRFAKSDCKRENPSAKAASSDANATFVASSSANAASNSFSKHRDSIAYTRRRFSQKSTRFETSSSDMVLLMVFPLSRTATTREAPLLGRGGARKANCGAPSSRIAGTLRRESATGQPSRENQKPRPRSGHIAPQRTSRTRAFALAILRRTPPAVCGSPLLAERRPRPQFSTVCRPPPAAPAARGRAPPATCGPPPAAHATADRRQQAASSRRTAVTDR